MFYGKELNFRAWVLEVSLNFDGVTGHKLVYTWDACEARCGQDGGKEDRHGACGD